MCGIIGYIGEGNTKGILLDGLKRLEYRGYDSAGIAILENSEMRLYRSEGRLSRLEEKLASLHLDGAVGIGHTRWATHGAPTEMNAHPHRVGHITLVHNGIIENYAELKAHLHRLGRKMASDTDTEVVAHLLDLEIEEGKPLVDALPGVLARLKGSYAFVILNDKEPDCLIGVRKGAPLLVGIGKKENFVASDVQAILHRTKNVIYLEDDQYVVCNREHVTLFDKKGISLPFKVKQIAWNSEQMEKSGYAHYMLKEIHEQSRSLTQTIEGNIDHTQGIVHLPELSELGSILKGIHRIVIVACGTAKHAGMIAQHYFERFTGLPTEVDFGSEFRYRDPLIDSKTLLILVSQSGETADTLAALREGRQRKVPTITICNVRESTMARESDVVLFTDAGPEIGVASTKAFCTQVAVLYMLALHLARQRSYLPEPILQELTSDLLQLPILVDAVLQQEKQIDQIAEAHVDAHFFFYMGRGIHYPIALEGALKLKEISYLHAEGYAAGELKHGPIALVDRHTTAIILAPQDRPTAAAPTQKWDLLSKTIHEKLMSNLQEVKSRGSRIWTIGTEEDLFYQSESNFYTPISRSTWALNPILLAIPLQLFAYSVAVKLGTDVDKPRNLAKSVTVE